MWKPQNHARQFQGIQSAFVKAYLIFVKMKKVKKAEEKIEKMPVTVRYLIHS